MTDYQAGAQFGALMVLAAFTIVLLMAWGAWWVSRRGDKGTR